MRGWLRHEREKMSAKKSTIQKPYVIINCAMTIDGKLALPSKKQTRISSEEDIARVYRLRNNCDAVVVGIGTILNDNPKLTVKEKYVKHPKQPTRVVLDSTFRTPLNAKVLDGTAPSIIAVSEKAKKKSKKIARFSDNTKIEIIQCGKEKIELKKLLKKLGERKIKKIMVEGGSTVIWSFLHEGLIDELKIYVGPMIIGGVNAPTMAGGAGAQNFDDIIPLTFKRCSKLGDGILLEYEKKWDYGKE
jgi:2,5-diamino-6-(ribosylamino)-4(3H)-pyrimidinone 5'-phosphate reductase